jgi:cytochrome c-type biogenesis protein CcmH/NrfG
MSSNKEKLSKTNYTFRMTEKEREELRKLGELEGSESNAIRRAIRLLMEARGLPIPDDTFVDKEAGNWLPKSEALASLMVTTSRAFA